MNSNPEGWGRRVVQALALILAVAFVGRWAYQLLAPLVPVAVSGVVVVIVVTAVLRRRRW